MMMISEDWSVYGSLPRGWRRLFNSIQMDRRSDQKSITVSGQDMKEDGWRMNFEEKGSFRTLAG